MQSAHVPNHAVQDARSSWRRFWGYATGTLPLPPQEEHGERALFGLAQPLFALRTLASDRVFLRAALFPALLLTLFCTLVALLAAQRGTLGFVRSFYRAFAVLAPVPSILLTRHYATLAATAHQRLGFGPCGVYKEGLGKAVWHSVKQVVVVALAVAPLLGMLGWMPLLGRVLAALVAFVWALHWIVVEAFDEARVVDAGSDQAAEPQQPWFIRSCLRLAGVLPAGLRWVPVRFARLCSWLSRPWHDEIYIIEAQPALMAGFALTTALLLATPVLNLLFRPIIIVAAVHLLGLLRGPYQEAG